MTRGLHIASSLCVIAVVLFLSFIVLYMPTSESFTTISSSGYLMPGNGVNGAVGTPNPTQTNNMYRTLQGVNALSDSGDLLQARQCYQFPDVIARGVFSNTNFGCHSTIIEGLFASLTDINGRIIQEITTFRDSTGSPIKGTVYALITQIPYFVNERGNPIEISYDVQNTTNFWPSGGSSPRQTVFYRIYVIFANYDTSAAYTQNSYFECSIISNWNKNYASNDKQCFIRCLQSNTACGCASASAGFYSDTPSYEVKCMGRDKTHNDQLAASTYGILFSVNQQYSLVKSYFTSA